MPKNLSKKRLKLKKQLKNDPFVWIIAYIDAKHISTVERDLNRYPDYRDISVYIPTVKILKKTFKKENFFEEVPLLFNYGFFKVPRKMAVFKDWLDDLQRNVPCIYGWVRDPANVMSSSPILRVDGKSVYETRENRISAATATSSEIIKLMKDTVDMGAHSADDISLLKSGDPIILRGYPWEGVPANVLKIDSEKKKVVVEMTMFDQLKEVTVSFDNVFFTIYHDKNYDDSLSNNDSMDDNSTGKRRFEKSIKKHYDGSND